MKRRFHKMHGLGNDFVIFDGRESRVEMTEGLARAIADRRTGIGCDQLILLEPSEIADVKMRIFNADGGEVQACGNAARCVTLMEGGETRIETRGGVIAGAAGPGIATVDIATVDMGEPRFDWGEIPLAYPVDTASMPVGWEDLQNPAAVNVGNPHVIFFVDDPDVVQLERLGPMIERDPLFPERVNVNVASVQGDRIKLRVWERGVGVTRACGTGACATAVAAIRRKLVPPRVDVRLPGGQLTIEWQPGEPIRMSGGATHAYSGEIDLEAFK